MSQLNDFLNSSRETGKLVITPVRTNGITPNTEIFARKLANVVRDVSPDVSIVSLMPKSMKPGIVDSQSSIAIWARSVVTALSARKPNSEITENLLDSFSNLHAAALAEYVDAMAGTPNRGQGLAGGVTALSGDLVFSKSADSVFESSFADAHALMTFSKRAGNSAAIEMASAVYEHRRASGDFGRFSMFSQSTDTAAAIGIVSNELAGGAAYGKLGSGDLTSHAIEVASQSTGLWMQKNGAPSGASNALSDVLGAVTEGMRLAAAVPKPEPVQRAGMSF